PGSDQLLHLFPTRRSSDLRALMQQLVKRVLRIRSRLAPDDGARGALHGLARAPHPLAVALHLELLQMGRESTQVVVVRQHRMARDRKSTRLNSSHVKISYA